MAESHVSSTSLPNSPRFHKLIRNKIRFRICAELLTSCARVLEDHGLKNDHPLSVPLSSTDPIKFYRQDYHKSLPNFPGRCVIALGRHTNKFFPSQFPITFFRYSSIQVVSWILVHPILADAIYHVVGAKEAL